MSSPEEIQTKLSSVKRYFYHATEAQQKLNNHLQKLLDLASHLKYCEDGVLWHLRYQVLQLRLDQEDVFKVLIRLHHNFCMAIGIDPKSSEERNLVHLQQLLGEENFKYLLSLLGNLVSKLSQAWNLQNKKQQQVMARKNLSKQQGSTTETLEFEAEFAEDADVNVVQEQQMKGSSIDAYEHELSMVTDLQAYFQYSMEQLTEALQAYEGIPKFGLIYDYIAGLQGPVSNFHTAFQSGLGYINHLMNSLNFPLLMQQQTEGQYNQKQLIANTLGNLVQIYRNIYQPALSPAVRPQAAPAISLTPSEEKLESESQLRRTLQFFPH